MLEIPGKSVLSEFQVSLYILLDTYSTAKCNKYIKKKVYRILRITYKTSFEMTL